MLSSTLSRVVLFRGVVDKAASSLLLPSTTMTVESVRHAWGPTGQKIHNRGKHRPNKHWDPKHRKARAAKVLKLDLPDYDFFRKMQTDELTPSEMRAFLKEKGLLPPQRMSEKAMYLSCTGAVLEEFVPPEGDGKASIMSKEGAKQNVAGVTKKGKSYMATRQIRKFEDDFDPTEFAEEAQEIYIKAHQALADKDEDALHKYATEKAYPEMVFNTENKTLRWQFLKSLEPPRVVQVRTQDVFSKQNLFAQITVRFNTSQTLAVYDRFGRLIHGSKVVAKDVLEYVVFEKHLANIYGSWRIHAKIIPDWLEKKEGGFLTHVLDPEPELEVIPPEEEEKKALAEGEKDSEDDSGDTKIYDRYGKVIGKAKASEGS